MESAWALHQNASYVKWEQSFFTFGSFHTGSRMVGPRHGLLNKICPNSARQEVRSVATPCNSFVAYPSADTKNEPVML
jgi:hypothetical protein